MADVGRAPTLEELPGWDLVEAGLRDLRAGVDSVPALLVAGYASRLRELGIDVPPHAISDAHIRMYLMLGQTHDDPYGRYNALLRRIVSFAEALACVH
jgi:hypothetical protein